MSQLHHIKVDGQLDINATTFPAVLFNKDNLNLKESILWIRENLQAIENVLTTSGAILFRGFALHDAKTFDAFSQAFAYPSFTYQESLSNAVRINHTERVFTANEAPKEVEIYLHHEMAQTPVSPDKLFFFCQTAADEGGATPICRSDALYQALKKANPELAEAFKNKGLKYTNIMPASNDANSGQGRSWKNTLNVDSVEAAETKLEHLGYSWEWLSDGHLKATTPVLPAVREINSNTQVFYNQLVAAYMGWEGVRENPSTAIRFGDDSHIDITALELIVKLSQQFTFDIPWQDGDMALVDNKMAMHGRRPYSGNKKRQVLVALAA